MMDHRDVLDPRQSKAPVEDHLYVKNHQSARGCANLEIERMGSPMRPHHLQVIVPITYL